MLIERSELIVRPDAGDEFLAALTERGVPLLKDVVGVVSVQAGRGVENPGKFILIVGWRSLADHAAYAGTPAAIELRGIMGPYVTGGAMEHFELT